MTRLTRPPLLEPCPAPTCGFKVPLVAHLHERHGFPPAEAKSVAIQILNKERLSVAASQRLGIPLQRVKSNRAKAVERHHEEPYPGFPSDAALNETIRRTFGEGGH